MVDVLCDPSFSKQIARYPSTLTSQRHAFVHAGQTLPLAPAYASPSQTESHSSRPTDEPPRPC